MVFTIGLGDAIWSGRIPGASFFIMMIVIIKSSPETIKQICFLLNYEVNNSLSAITLTQREPLFMPLAIRLNFYAGGRYHSRL